jgi:hypothetical protein
MYGNFGLDALVCGATYIRPEKAAAQRAVIAVIERPQAAEIPIS